MEREHDPMENPQIEAVIESPVEERHIEVLEQTESDSWGILDSVGKKIKDNGWYKSLFNGKTKEQLETDRVSPDLVARLVRTLEQGRYIGPLVTQPISWSDTKIYRDYVQNFFDGMGEVTGRPTLDGVNFSHRNVKEGGQSFVEFTITSPAEYDHRYLIHHGGTTKAGDDRVAGGFGEGVKVASFLLLKNGVTNQVELGSGNWVARYYLDELPEEDYPERVRGLHLRAEFVERDAKGNFLRFRVGEKLAKNVQAQLSEMKDFFWHEGHPDFREPTYANDFGGFKILPRGRSGNLYVAGQRYEYEKPEAWSNAVPGATVWTFQKVLERTRDRNYAPSYEISDKVIEPLVKAMTKEDLLKVFYECKDYWLDMKGNSVAERIVSEVVHRLSKELTKEEKDDLKSKLPADIFAQGGERDKEYEKMLETAGYRRCMYEFRNFGVSTARETVLSLVETAKEPKLESWENQRVEILNRAVRVFIDSAKSNIIDRYTKFLKSPADKELLELHEEGFSDSFNSSDYSAMGRLSAWDVISRFQHGEVPSLAIRETGSLQLKGGKGRIELHGFTRLFPENIFLQKKMLGGDFLEALFTWFHEFAHNISGEKDFTAGFADAERYLHELLLITSFNNDELKKLQAEWDNIKVNKSKTPKSLEDE